MIDFTFHSPTKFIFGRDSESQVGRESKSLGAKILLHYGGGSIKKSGLYDRVLASLRDARMDFVELGGVVANPLLSMVREGIDLCRREGVTGILAVGGGSVIDSAKAIALGVLYDGDVWDFFTGSARVERALPLGVVLTIPAAGSEGSDGCVVTEADTKSKFACGGPALRPVFAISNPELTYTLPSYQTACGCADIMSHVMERYFTNTSGVDFSDRLCEATMRTIIHNLPIVLEKPQDYDARGEIMWASTLAHNDVMGAGREQDWASHQIEHELSAQYDVAHGAGLAVVFPAWIQHVHRTNPQRFIQWALRVWDVDYHAGREDEVIQEGIKRLKAFYRAAGLPVNLQELGVTDDRYEIMADKAMRDGPFGGLTKLNKDDVVAIYRLAEQG